MDKLLRENKEIINETKRLELKIEKRSKENPMQENFEDGLELELKNLRFKVKYLTGKI